MAFAWESNARSYCRSIPKVFTRADSYYLYDEDGNEYLDFLNAAGTLLLGHNHPNIRKAIESVKDPIISFLDMRTSVEQEFVQTLIPKLPFKNKNSVKLHFCSPAGGDAVEAAIKLTIQKTGRDGIFSFYGGYHGMTQGSLAVTSNKKKRAAGLHARDNVTFFPFPYAYRFPKTFGSDEAAAEFCLANLRMALADDHSGIQTPAAMILEPIQGEGGTIIPPNWFLQEVRAICDEYGIILICDEIQAGLGRCGKWFSCELSGIEPDIMTISKGIGGGFPLALIAFKEELNCWNPGDHIGTFRGQHYALAAGKALLETIESENILENAATKGALILERLNKLQEQYPDIIGQPRGQGLYMGVEMNKDLQNPGDITGMIQQRMLEKGIVMETGGRFGSVLRLLPALHIDDKNTHVFLDSFEQALDETSGKNAAILKTKKAA